MRLLLDTHPFIWLSQDDPLLSPAAREIFADPDNELLLSAAAVGREALGNKGRTCADLDFLVR